MHLSVAFFLFSMCNIKHIFASIRNVHFSSVSFTAVSFEKTAKPVVLNLTTRGAGKLYSFTSDC